MFVNGSIYVKKRFFLYNFANLFYLNERKGNGTSDHQTSSCAIIAIVGRFGLWESLHASTVHKELCHELGCEEIGIIAEDSYYKDQSHLEMSERVKTNYDQFQFYGT